MYRVTASGARWALLLLVLPILLIAAACGGRSGPDLNNLSPGELPAGAERRSATLEEAVADIHDLAVPGGVDSKTFALLQDALVHELLASGKSRFVSALPLLQLSQVDDLTVHANP